MHLNPLQPHWFLCNHPAEYRFSSAILAEVGVCLSGRQVPTNLKMGELNVSYSHRLFLTVPLLVKAIIDHAPPVFSKSNFSDICGY